MELNLTKEQQLILLGLIASIAVGVGVMAYRHFFAVSNSDIIIETPKFAQANLPAPQVLVHISGAVRKDGVYKMELGDRLLDAIKMAGGALPSADLSAVNLAEPVKDGVKIIIPVKQEVLERGSGTSSGKVNITAADENALDSLPGVGPSTAKAIIEYRRTNGPFTRLEQIMEIPRFGKAKFERIKDKITI
jgi:competence protein ComEA